MRNLLNSSYVTAYEPFHTKYQITLSTFACEACCNVFKMTSRYLVKSVPTARAMSPKTDKMWGLTEEGTAQGEKAPESMKMQ